MLTFYDFFGLFTNACLFAYKTVPVTQKCEIIPAFEGACTILTEMRWAKGIQFQFP